MPTFPPAALDAAWLASQSILAPGAEAAIAARIHSWLLQHPQTTRALDVGCGPVSRLRGQGVDWIGVDIEARSGVAASATCLPFATGSFGSVWSFGLLHHLRDAEANQALEEMRRVTRRGGFVIVFDGVLPPDRRSVASLIRRMDRGAHFRQPVELERMLSEHGDWTVERFTYSLTGLEGLFSFMRASEEEPTCP